MGELVVGSLVCSRGNDIVCQFHIVEQFALGYPQLEALCLEAVGTGGIHQIIVIGEVLRNIHALATHHKAGGGSAFDKHSLTQNSVELEQIYTCGAFHSSLLYALIYHVKNAVPCLTDAGCYLD